VAFAGKCSNYAVLWCDAIRPASAASSGVLTLKKGSTGAVGQSAMAMPWRPVQTSILRRPSATSAWRRSARSATGQSVTAYTSHFHGPKPGGELHIVDFGGQERLPSWFRAGLRQWLARFHVSPRDELAAELAGLAGHAGRLNCLERPHGGYAQYAVFHRGLAG